MATTVPRRRPLGNIILIGCHAASFEAAVVQSHVAIAALCVRCDSLCICMSYLCRHISFHLPAAARARCNIVT